MSNRWPGGIIRKTPVTPAGPYQTSAASGMWTLAEAAYWEKQGLWPDPYADAYWAYTSLLLSTTSLGNANNNLFVDSSGAFNPVSRFGNTTQGSFTPYSTNWSNYFDGSGDYLTLPSNSALEISSGDFTIEAWVFKESNGNYQSIYSNWNDSNSGGVLFCMNGLTPSFLWRPFNISTAMATGPVVTANTWTHVAVVRSGNVFTVYTNGVAGTPVTYSTNATAAQTYQVGAYAAGASGNFNGYMSNVRVVKGTAVYTSNFTVPTSPLTAISGTSLLTCQSNRFRDASSNNFTITVNGNTSVTDFGPFSPGTAITYNQSDITNWSGYFDGTGDYLTVPNNTAFDFGSGNFTIEMWVYRNNATNPYALFAKRNSSDTETKWVAAYVNTNGTIQTQVSVNGSSWAFNTATTSAVGTATWAHVAFVRNGSDYSVYVDGVKNTISSSLSGSVFTDTNPVEIGQLGLSGSFLYSMNGSISNFRIVKGTAVYTSNFTPSTTNLTAISGTSLLTLQNAAFTDNSTNNFVITPYGNATVTGNSPFNTAGYWSNYFDGSTSRMSVADNAAFGFGTGNFTIEFWLNYTGGNGYKFFFVNYSASGNYVGYGLQNGTLTPWVWNNGDVLVASSNITQNTWQHHALVRNGSTLTIYLNGTAIGSTTWTTDLGSSRPFYIGWNGGNDSQTTQGNISNFRVVKGTAVYTSNFTPPTSPLTAITNTSLLTCQNGRFIDNSTNNFAVTVSGTTTIQSFDPFYTATIASNGGSMYFDGSGDYLKSPSSAAFGVGTGNFTIEAWIFPTGAWTSGGFNCLLQIDGTGIYFGQNSGGFGLRQSGTANIISYGTSPTLNTWTHVAIVRSGTTVTMYYNGVSVATATSSANFSSGSAWVGSDATPGNYYTGYVSGLRLISGTALYTAAFTPPTAPVTPTAATTLLINGMNAGIYDATTINDMETVGNAQVSTVQSKFGGSSVYFDGSGDALAARPNPVFAFGTSSFTIEAWVNVTSYAGTCAILDTRTAGNEATGVIFYINASGQLSIYNNGTLATSSGSISTGTWTHVAVTRNGTTVTFWINGSSSGTATVSTNFTQQNGYVGTAYNASSNPFYGYMDDLRVTKGVARYTANFTPPTQPFPVY